MNKISENSKKPGLGSDYWPIWPKFGTPIFLKKNLAPSVTRYHGQLSPCAISEKTNDPMWRKLSDGQTE